MVKSFAPFAASAAVLIATASAASVPDGTWPTSTGTVQYSEAYTVAAGEVFDGEMQTFERSDITCNGQEESGSSTAVFLVEAGATLKNVIIGANQMEGVHCDDSDCTIENVWWDDVCEDALSIKGGSASSVSTVTGGGARSADDKVVQHNGYGTVKIDGFYAEDFGKLYRSCGTCGDKQRFVSVSNVYAVNPGKSIVTVNQNYGDEATLSNIWIKSDDDGYAVCAWSEGNADGEPTELGDGPSDPLCQYSESDIHVNEDVSTATSSSTTTTTEATEVPSATAAASESSAEETTEAPADTTEASESSEEETTEAPATSSDASAEEEESTEEGSESEEDTADEAATSNSTTTETPTVTEVATIEAPTVTEAAATPASSSKCDARRKRN
ncbi:hypothetical protein BBJ28_00022631 [Nothophytophthora sp. Chile5]|nr:hypothetical protein BBJ28_00022631 [Nothophytophthora sp. Chile5]